MKEYEKAFIEGDHASAVRVGAENISLLIALDQAVKGGAIVGQNTFDETLRFDCWYSLNPERKREQIVSNFTDPQYESPEERLKRPVILHTGVTRTIEVKEHLAESRPLKNGVDTTVSFY